MLLKGADTSGGHGGGETCVYICLLCTTEVCPYRLHLQYSGRQYTMKPFLDTLAKEDPLAPHTASL